MSFLDSKFNISQFLDGRFSISQPKYYMFSNVEAEMFYIMAQFFYKQK